MVNDAAQIHRVLPLNAFIDVLAFEKFEADIAGSQETQQRLISEFLSTECPNPEKFVRMAWRKIMVDEVAEHFCWRGTTHKKSIRGMAVTFSLRSAFKQKFLLDDSLFDIVCRKHFQYAHDRHLKLKAYHTNKKNDSTIETTAAATAT